MKKAQDGVLEFLLVNHPLDCPVCDKGGECPLQDQTLAYGPGESRFVEEKRHFEKPIAISELVLLDRERCIQCARCTRFADEVAGEAADRLRRAGASRSRSPPSPTEPVLLLLQRQHGPDLPGGALTATPYRFTARPWDLDQVESTCTTCAVGCRVAVQSSANRLTRLLGIDSDPVNQGWLCDKGRFGFEAVNGESAPTGRFAGEARTRSDRDGSVTEPLVRKDGELVAVSWSEALPAAAGGSSAAREAGGPGAVAVLGGARLHQRGRLRLGQAGQGGPRHRLGRRPAGRRAAGRAGARRCRGPRSTRRARPVVVLLTGDVREELPVLFLRLRGRRSTGTTALVELASAADARSRRTLPSVCRPPGRRAGAGPGADRRRRRGARRRPTPRARLAAPATWTGARAAAGGPAAAGAAATAWWWCWDGRRWPSTQAVVAEAAGVLAAALPGARFLPALRRGNVHGRPRHGPGARACCPAGCRWRRGGEWFAERWGSVPADPGLDAGGDPGSLAGARRRRRAPDRRVLIVLGADPLGDFPDRHLAAGPWPRPSSWSRWPATRPTSRCAPTWCCRRPWPTSGRARRPTSRAGSAARPEAGGPGPGLARLDDRRRAGRGAGRGPRVRAPDRASGRRSSGWPRPTPAHAGERSTRRRRATAWSCRFGAPGLGPGRRSPADRPDGHPGRRVGRAPGGAAPGRAAESPAAEESAVTGPSDRRRRRPAATDRPRPARCRSRRAGEAPHVPPPTATRCGWSRAAASTTAAPRSPPRRRWPRWSPTAVVRANPYDLDRLGVATGDQVRVRSARAALVLAGRGRRRACPRGVVAVDFNLPAPDAGGDGANSRRRPGLIDATAVCDRRAAGVASVTGAALLGAHHAGDPLFDHGVGWFVWVVVVIKVLVAFGVLLVSVMLMIWFERKVISDMQSRIGPNRAGPWGLLQTLADGIKLFFKEDLLPERADRVVFKLAPYLSLLPALLIFTVVPGRRHHHHRRPHLRAAGGRPAHRDPARAGHVVASPSTA